MRRISPPFPQRLIWASGVACLKHACGLDEKRCIACLEPFTPKASNRGLMVCDVCLTNLPRRQTGYCPLCGEVTAMPDAACVPCGACLIDKPPWRHFRFYGVFEGLLRDLLHRAKFNADVACLELLGAMLADVCRDLPRPDAIVPMPLHSGRLRRRGYNQCREIARPLARTLDAPVRDDLLVRKRATFPQTGLSRKERTTNLHQAFTGRVAAENLHILLIDDTATTGTSLRMAAKALLQAGAVQVDVAVVAHTSLHGD